MKYCGKLSTIFTRDKRNYDNLEQILIGADYLLMFDLVAVCEKGLSPFSSLVECIVSDHSREFPEINCVAMWQFAVRFQLKKLIRKSLDGVYNFFKIYVEPQTNCSINIPNDFNFLSIDDSESLMQSEVPEEVAGTCFVYNVQQTVFMDAFYHIAVAWLAFKLDERKVYSERLLARLPIDRLPLRQLVCLFKRKKVFGEDALCKLYIEIYGRQSTVDSTPCRVIINIPNVIWRNH